MSVQIFLQGKLLGIQEFLLAPATGDADAVFIGRSHWVSLLAEVLPRALLAELGLARILLGSSGGGQFLVVLPDESRGAAEDLLARAAAHIGELSGGLVKLVWSVTENLGDWSDVRKRLNDEMQRLRGAPAAGARASLLETAPAPVAEHDEYFAEQVGKKLREASAVGWSPEEPGKVTFEAGKQTWSLSDQAGAIPLARHAALNDDGSSPASVAGLGRRAEGRPVWGVLRGDVDNLGIRIRRVQTIEEHIQLSVMFKQFFAGELEVLCSMPEFWRKVTVLYAGGDDFAAYGCWEALIPLAREMQRLFHRFAEENLKDFPGLEGKTISMALALAPAPDATLASVFETAGERLEVAKSADKDCIWLLGRTLEWKQFTEASDLKESLVRMVTEYGCSPEYLREVCGIYRETQSRMSRRQARRSGTEKPWRYHRRISRLLGASREREFQKARTQLIAALIGRGTGYVKLRPSGRVALEWARLSTEG